MNPDMQESNWWTHIKRWLAPNGKPEVPALPLPVRHELIKRSPTELNDYESWKRTNGPQKTLAYISKNYHTWLNTPCEQCQHIDFLCLPSSRGFVLHLMDTEQNGNEVTHLFDFLKEKVIALGYRSYVSDVRFFKRKRWTERNERHYLKPPPSFLQNGQNPQRFGNISIELRFRDNDPLHLKFCASSYQDHRFSSAEDFGTLMGHLLCAP
jgi:hypothetical protein